MHTNNVINGSKVDLYYLRGKLNSSSECKFAIREFEKFLFNFEQCSSQLNVRQECLQCTSEYARLNESVNRVNYLWSKNPDCEHYSSQKIMDQFYHLSTNIWTNGHCDGRHENRMKININD